MTVHRSAKCIVSVAWLLAILVPLHADTVKLTNGLAYRRVTVVGFEKGFLFFGVRAGRTVSKKLEDVAHIVIDGEADFNAAEASRLAGRREEGKERYRKAGLATKTAWVRALARARSDSVAPQIPDGSGKPTSRPLPLADGRFRSPTSAPTAAVDPLSSPEALTRLIHEEPTPPEYSAMTLLQRQEQQKAFETKLQVWRKRTLPTGKTVTWVLRASDVTRDDKSGKLVLSGTSTSGLQVEVFFSEASKETLVALSKGDMVTVAGTVRQWRTTSQLFGVLAYEASFVLDGVSLKRGGTWAPLLHVSSVRHVVLVIDRSGSMLDSFDTVLAEISKAISNLTPEQTFHVIFFARGTAGENPPRRLVYANDANRAQAHEFLKKVTASGGSPTNPLAAIKRGFEVLARPPNKQPGKILFLLTDGEFHDNKEVRRMIKKWNHKNDVSVNTILYATGSGEIRRALKQIAEENGGTFKQGGL